MKRLKLGKKFKTVYKGKIFTIKQRKVVYPDGTKDHFEYCQRPDSVNILAFNDKQELLLIKEYRPGPKKIVWFVPAGRIDQKGDTPKKAAQRELREEAGYRAKKMKLLRKRFLSNTSILDIYVFVAKDLVKDPLPDDKGEEIAEVKFVPLKKAVKMAVAGEIANEFIAYNILHFDYLLKHKKFKW